MSEQKQNSLQLKILMSRLLTRSGDQAWDFAVPVTLMTLFPAQISLVAFLYLIAKLGSVIFQPRFSQVIDHWQRMKTATVGILMQLMSLILVCFCIYQLAGKADLSSTLWSQPYVWPLLAGISIGTVTSNLGANLMDIAVGNDWIPTVVPAHQLSEINSRLQRLDLLTEVLAPVIAGTLLAINSESRGLNGFGIIVAWNIVSFIPELLLLRTVFLSSTALQTMNAPMDREAKTEIWERIQTGWMEFKNQDAAAAMLAYSFLWLSALSPHGVLLTSFLKSGWNLSETSLGIFRGLGAIFGLVATLTFPRIRQHFGLIAGSRLCIVFQALVLLLALPFFYLETGGGWVFLALILISRVGLYGFSLGEQEIRQRMIPEGMRGKINGVANSLNQLATLILFGLGSLLSDQNHFAFMVIISTCAVAFGALVFIRWSAARQSI